MKNPILVFVDAGVDNYQKLFDGVVAEAKPFILHTATDGIQQIDQILQQYPGQKTVHIISHGAPGCLYLGNTQLSLDTLKQYTPQLQQWDLDNLLLYGCHVAAGDAGEEFVSKLQGLTGANIAASKSLTGAEFKGGNWELEVNTGKVKVPTALQTEVMGTYTGVFNLELETDFASGQVIVKPRGFGEISSLSSLQARLGATTINTTKTDLGLQLWSIPGDVEDFISRNQNNPLLEYIEPNYTITLDSRVPDDSIINADSTVPNESIINADFTAPNDTFFNLMWGLHNTGQTGGTSDADIDALEAWDIQTGSNNVVVGVIDTGIDYTHPDLANNMWTNPGEIPGNGIDDDGNGYVDDVYGYDFAYGDNDPIDLVDGHGTHVAGTIGADGNNGQGVVGVNWNVDLMAIKFLDDNGSGTTFGAIQAIEYATMMGADLTNNSWGGGGFSQGLYDAIAAAGAADSLFIAAAGNSGTNNDATPHYPDGYDLDNIISVASTDHNDNLSSFSQYGATSVDLGAPGSSIASTVPGGYAYLSGTSMATPHVSGVAALVLAENPDLSYQEVKDIILESTDPISALDGKTVTGGRLNAFKALSLLNATPTDITLANDTIDENVAANSVVSTLSTTDTDDGDTFTYELVSGEGDTDNAAFTIDGDQLKINSSPDYETQSSYNIRVQTTDAAGETYEEEFTININDVNEVPTDLNLDNNSIDENVAANTLVGTLSTTDPDDGDTFTYELVSGEGDTDNAAFTIDGDQLKINNSPDYETQSSYNIRVQTTDAAGETYEEEFTISVNDVSEPVSEPVRFDFNADGVADILWRNGTNGVNSIWLMNNDGTRNSSVNPGGIGTAWDVAGVDDFNADGVADILWRNNNGANSIWLMNNDGTRNSSVNPGGIGTAWDVAGVADFNADGVADILWRNDNGVNSI
ncbi:MAG: S8 family serine peptidase, partial [Cyanobacteria bacterium P01_H01_bin.35]